MAFEILIKFKNDKSLFFTVETKENLKEQIESIMLGKSGTLVIADYLINLEEILYIKIEGEKIELSGEKL